MSRLLRPAGLAFFLALAVPLTACDALRAEFYFYRGVAQHDEGQLDEAISSFRTAIELQPDYLGTKVGHIRIADFIAKGGMGVTIPVLSALLLGGTGAATAASSQQFVDEAEIRKLTVNYAKATDALGTGDAAQVAAGRELYRRTFTADAQIKAGESPTLTGPDAWADYVMEALSRYSTTQHLVGSIDVQLDPPKGASEASTGKMTSYLHATHEFEPGGNIWIVLGTYVDDVVRTPEGWRISRRTLVFTSTETREHKPAATP